MFKEACIDDFLIFINIDNNIDSGFLPPSKLAEHN